MSQPSTPEAGTAPLPCPFCGRVPRVRQDRVIVGTNRVIQSGDTAPHFFECLGGPVYDSRWGFVVECKCDAGPSICCYGPQEHKATSASTEPMCYITDDLAREAAIRRWNTRLATTGESHD